MMPIMVQGGIRRSWAAALTRAMKHATPEQVALLQKMLNRESGAADEIAKAFKDGVLDSSRHYQFVNPSEFWAVNGSRILDGRYQVKGTWVAAAKQWLAEFIEKMKGMLGRESDAEVLKGLNAVLKGDGTFVSRLMVSGPPLKPLRAPPIKPPRAPSAPAAARSTVDGVPYRSRADHAREMRKELTAEGHDVDDLMRQDSGTLRGWEDIEPRVVDIDDIPTTGSFKPREPQRVRGATEFIESGEEMMPPLVGLDANGKIISVSDGVHRIEALRKAGKKQIVVDTYRSTARAPSAPAAGVVETATDASVAGAKTPADIKVAQSMWKKMGVLSPYFKKWFGGSKVVDKAGKPIVVYHGSGTSKIDQFKHEKAGGLFWFTPKRPVAESYALHRRGVNTASEDAWEDALESGVIDDTFENFVTDAYLSLKNPLDLRDPEAFRVLADLDPEFGAAHTSEYGQELARKVINRAKSIEKGGSDYQFWMITQHEKGAHAWSNILTPQLEARGYDGLIMNDAADTGLAYAAFKPTQIKSVKNRGTFDPTDARILYGLAPAAVLKSQLRKDEG